MHTDPMIPVSDLTVDDEFHHAESGKVVLRVRARGTDGEPSMVIFYGVDGQFTGGTYDRLTDEMLAEYAAAMPLVLTRGD